MAAGIDSAALPARGASTPHDLLHKRVVVCVGCGGVGKTTVAAALAVAAALHHRRTAVITFDPVRRLKDSLGLTQLSTEPQQVPLAEGAATLDAMALDTKHTFDAVVRRFAPTLEVANRILANRIYQQLSDELGGSAEYMAMEKLHELAHRRRYGILVVDTPPSAHARDLLTAPTRLADLLGSRATTLLQTPAAMLGAGSSPFARLTLVTLLKVLQRWTGLHLLKELAGFVSGFETMIGGFQTRANEVERLLRGRSTAFVLVTSPEPDAVATAIDFNRELQQGGFHVAGVVANRVLAFPRYRQPTRETARWPPVLRRKLLANYENLYALSRRDRRTLTEMQQATGLPVLAAIPLLTEPPTSLDALRRFAAFLAPELDDVEIPAVAKYRY